MAVKVFPWRLSSEGVYVANFDTVYVRHEQDFQVGDIFTLMGDIAGLSGWDSEKKLVSFHRRSAPSTLSAVLLQHYPVESGGYFTGAPINNQQSTILVSRYLLI
jgi:hypothetical protein